MEAPVAFRALVLMLMLIGLPVWMFGKGGAAIGGGQADSSRVGAGESMFGEQSK